MCRLAFRRGGRYNCCMKTLMWTGWIALLSVCLAAGQTISRNPYIGAIVIDAADGTVLFEDGADRPGYPASMLKLMGLFVVSDRIRDGVHRLDETVAVTREAAEMGGTQVYLDTRESFPLEDMLYAMIVASANDAAMALAIHVGGSREGFVELMNRKARDLGLSPITRFQSPHGLPPKDRRPDMTTARDFAILCKALLDTHPDVLRYTSTTDREFRPEPKLFMMHTRNRLLRTLPGCDGLKTGFFRDAGYSIASTVQRNGARVIVVILGSEARQTRDDKVVELVNRYLPQAKRAVAVTPPPPVPRPSPPPVPAPVGVEDDPEDDESMQEDQPKPSGKGVRIAVSLLIVGFGLAAVVMAVQRRLLVRR